MSGAQNYNNPLKKEKQNNVMKIIGGHLDNSLYHGQVTVSPCWKFSSPKSLPGFQHLILAHAGGKLELSESGDCWRPKNHPMYS